MAVAKASTAILDFSNTKDGVDFNKKRVPAGDYLAKVTRVVDSPTKESKEPQWLFTFQLVDRYTDRKFPYYCKLVENQLWKVRNLFIAAGLAIPKKRVKLDPNRVVGKLVGLTLEDEEYENKLQSQIAAIISASELEDSDSSAEGDEEDELEEGTETEDEEESEDEEPEEETDDEEEDEEEEPAPAPKKAAARIPAQRKSSPAPAKKVAARRKPAPVEDEELEELDLEDL